MRVLLSEDSPQANALIRWGDGDCILTHPLHYVCDVLFEGTLQRGREAPLIGAASLGAEGVGLRLLDAARGGPAGGKAPRGVGCQPQGREGSSTPMGWAVHGWRNPPAGNCGRQREVVLVSGGANIEPEWLESEEVRGDPEMLAALGGGFCPFPQRLYRADMVPRNGLLPRLQGDPEHANLIAQGFHGAPAIAHLDRLPDGGPKVVYRRIAIAQQWLRTEIPLVLSLGKIAAGTADHAISVVLFLLFIGGYR